MGSSNLPVPVIPDKTRCLMGLLCLFAQLLKDGRNDKFLFAITCKNRLPCKTLAKAPKERQIKSAGI
ncbi:MAG: hypothetical protein AYP45_16875 [Candidatus Brocadia carolinensis]|uniref:Uncharacterized protein n=1 Tax=Candidatus Brocadia carolinensis TaxID=1004156 RepID=A0A1V4APP1_9BACT|nr:MAG: hypothetical protein AYP45_16875 [Candidatus Brocadia caroliniensis]